MTELAPRTRSTFLQARRELMRHAVRAATLSVAGAAILLCCTVRLGAAQEDPIDIQRAKQLYQRVQNGETLSPEEQDYLDRVRKEVQRRRQQKEGTRAFGPTDQQKGGNPGPVPPATPSTGLIPLTDLGTDKYKGQDGGLYGGGRNEPPAECLAAIVKQLQLIRPLDAGGHPAPDGKIVLLSVGMSNATRAVSPCAG